MADPLDYYKIDRAGALKKLNIPPWFVAFVVHEKFEMAEESVTVDSFWTQVVIEKSYVRRGGRCFRIDDFSIYGWTVFATTGTLALVLHLDPGAVPRALRELSMILLADSGEAFADALEPTSGVVAAVADFAATIAKRFTNLPIPVVFGDLAELREKVKLVEKFDEIVMRAKAVVAELNRLQALDRRVFARFAPVRMVTSLRRTKLYSRVELVEVVCADFILALPEGEALRVEAEDEVIMVPEPIPPPKARSGGGKGARAGFGFGDVDDPRPLPRKALKAIRQARRPLEPAEGPRPAPGEVVRSDKPASPARPRQARSKGPGKRR